MEHPAIWAAQLTRPLTEKEQAIGLDALPPLRRARLPRNRTLWREPLCAYALLRLALSGQLTALPELAHSHNGKPYFPAMPSVQFSLSHTDGGVVVAIWDRPVGVDIERLRPLPPLTARRLGDVDATAFWTDWVRREAAVKRRDAGLAALAHGEAGEGILLDLFPGYAAAVSTGGTADAAEIHLVRQEALLDTTWDGSREG
ncbi:MAG: 4'-phosphopantetheinyl transferase [Oscillospiraceae bacterium]